MPINIITFDFTYDLPDKYLYQTNNDGNVGTIAYTGPDAIYVAVDKITGKLDQSADFIADDGEENTLNIATIKAGVDRQIVRVDARKEPVIAWLMVPQDIDRNAMPQKEYKLDNGEVYYKHPDPIIPDHAYEIDEIEYDLNNKTWVKPLPWKKPHMDWVRLERAIAMNIALAQRDIKDGGNSTKLNAYINELKGLKEKFAHCDPWTISFPEYPNTIEA